MQPTARETLMSLPRNNDAETRAGRNSSNHFSEPAPGGSLLPVVLRLDY